MSVTRYKIFDLFSDEAKRQVLAYDFRQSYFGPRPPVTGDGRFDGMGCCPLGLCLLTQIGDGIRTVLPSQGVDVTSEIAKATGSPVPPGYTRSATAFIAMFDSEIRWKAGCRRYLAKAMGISTEE